MKPAITVIVPIYNVEQYICKSIESILSQTLNNIEVILVDDGSTDRSYIIADSYAEKDARVKVIHQKNRGVSRARNLGISVAKGKYIAFIDPDDWIDCDMFQKLYSQAIQNDCDVVSCCFFREDIKNNRKIKEDHPFTPNEVLFKYDIKKEIYTKLLTNGFFTAVWDKIYRRSFLEKYKIRMRDNVKFREDYIFNMDVFAYAERIKYLPIAFYHYRDTPNSASRKYYKNLLKFDIILYNKKKEYCKIWFSNDQKYLNIISRDFIIDVFHNIMQVYNKNNISIIKDKWKEIHNIVNCSYVRQSILQYKGCLSFKDKINYIKIILIKNKRIILLNLLSFLINNISIKNKIRIKNFFNINATKNN